jgi:hypothetical protein
MPAKNIYHDAVIAALKADGWKVTHDPLTIRIGKRDLHIDLGAEWPVVGAEKNGDLIAVEVQSFLNLSDVRSLQEAIGQYELYRVALDQQQPDRQLYLAVPLIVYDGIFSEPLGQLAVTELHLRVLIFDPVQQQVVKWIA